MNITIPKAFNSVWSGLVTGMVVATAALVPVMANAQSQPQSSIKASAQSELKGQTNQWSDNNTAKPGETLKYIVNYQNVGNSSQGHVVVRASLPANVSLVPGSVLLYNSGNPDGAKQTDNAITAESGMDIGSYGPGANAYVTFEAQIAAADKLSCGDNQLKLNGSVQPQDTDKTDVSATTTVKRECAAKQSPVPATPPATTTPSTPTTPTPPATTPEAPAAATDGKSGLPNTGAGDIFAIFGVAAVAGFIGHKLVLARLARR